ncbi:hypothetical protein BC826DRAFT_397694 [Russula brevipes]|nr:hypothetical protein BC826DRAFT_397694 [Russula brevipes]
MYGGVHFGVLRNERNTAFGTTSHASNAFSAISRSFKLKRCGVFSNDFYGILPRGQKSFQDTWIRWRWAVGVIIKEAIVVRQIGDFKIITTFLSLEDLARRILPVSNLWLANTKSRPRGISKISLSGDKTIDVTTSKKPLDDAVHAVTPGLHTLPRVNKHRRAVGAELPGKYDLGGVNTPRRESVRKPFHSGESLG